MACKRSGVRIPVAPQVSPGETPISSPPRQPSRSSDRHLTVVLGGMNEHRAPSPDRRWHPRHRRSQAPLNSCRPAGEAAESVICPAERAGGQIPGGLGTRGGDRPPANEPCRWPGDRMPSRPLRLCSRRLPDRTFRRHSRSSASQRAALTRWPPLRGHRLEPRRDEARTGQGRLPPPIWERPTVCVSDRGGFMGSGSGRRSRS